MRTDGAELGVLDEGPGATHEDVCHAIIQLEGAFQHDEGLAA